MLITVLISIMSSSSSSDNSLFDIPYQKEKNTLITSVSCINSQFSKYVVTRSKQEENLLKYLDPDPLNYCHLSFENVLWKPPTSVFKAKKQDKKHNPLFALVNLQLC